MRSIHQPDAHGFISGVYNYCDRRCERCRFVMQCRVGRVEADDVEYEDEDSPVGVPSSPVQRFEKMMDEMVQSKMEDDEQEEMEKDEEAPLWGVEELNAMCTMDPDEEAEYERKRKEVGRQVAAEPLTNFGRVYMGLSTEWIRSRQGKLKAMGFDLLKRLDMAMTALPAEMLILREALDELIWHQTMLPAKLNRALRGRIEDAEMDEAFGLDPQQSDWNGTAKLCLHIVERCSDAWASVAGLLPEEAMDVVRGLD